MEPFRIIKTPEELAALTISTIVCPVHQPGLAYRKAWSDLFTTFEPPKEWDSREIWTILTMHCPGTSSGMAAAAFPVRIPVARRLCRLQAGVNSSVKRTKDPRWLARKKRYPNRFTALRALDAILTA